MTADRFGRAGRTWAALVVACALSGCGSSSSTPAPRPTASGSATGTYLTGKRAGIAALEIALATLRAHVLVTEFARPGRGPLAPVTSAAPVPACDAASATATSTTTDPQNGYFTTRFAFYPGGDATCSQAPQTIGALFYPNPLGPYAPAAPQPLIGQGFIEQFSTTSDPYYRGGHALLFANLTLTAYGYADGRANLVLGLTQQNLTSFAGVPVQPAAGTFPATFPSSIIAAPPAPNEDFVVDGGLAVLETSGATQSALVQSVRQMPVGGTLSQVGQLGNTIQFSNDSSAATAATTTTVTTTPGGNAFTGTAQQPLYGFDVKRLGLAGFPPASGSLAIGFTPVSVSGFATAPANYASGAAIDTATVTLGGVVTDAHEVVVDTLNQVKADVTASNGVMSFSVTDLLSNQPLVTPAAVPIDALGISAPFVYASDGTAGIVHGYKVIE